MTQVRTITAALAFLAVSSAPALAQQWGGSPPVRSSGGTVSSRAQRAPYAEMVYRGFYTLVPAPPAGVTRSSGSANSGGSWNGAQPTWGGSPPPAPVRRGPVYYIPTPVLVAPVGVSAVSAYEARSAVPLRRQYLQRRRP